MKTDCFLFRENISKLEEKAMSMTTSAGVFGPRYWSYMAKVMARQLDKAIETKHIEADFFPKGVYKDAEKFFSLVRGAIEYGKTIPDNPSASINAYAIASRAVKGVSTSSKLSLEQLKEKLEDCADFVSSLSNSRPLEPESEEIAKLLRDFFYQLALDGDNEIYRTRVDIKPRSMGIFRWMR